MVLEYGGKVKEIAAKGSGEESQSKENMVPKGGAKTEEN
jgi:hypothetical protein